MTLCCVICSSELEPCLARAGSIRCHDCRDGLVAGDRTPLRADPHVELPVAHENTFPTLGQWYEWLWAAA